MVEQLENLLKQNLLPNGILLVGSHKEGLTKSAKILAAKILLTKNLEFHPDYIYINSHKVDDINRLLSVLALKSFSKRVIVLDSAENLTPHSVNNLLKKIEEPSSETFFLILTTHEEKLLSTLRSRLMVFYNSKIGVEPESSAAIDFLSSKEVEDRVNTVSAIDSQSEDLNLFLKKLYQDEIKSLSSKTSRRLDIILRTQELLSANVQANRALSWLAINW